MTKRQIRKEAYRRIIKENQQHQFAYDEMCNATPNQDDLIATEISKYPDIKRREKKKNIVLVYVIVLGFIVVMRSLSMMITSELYGLEPLLLLLALLLSIVLPVMGIVFALIHKVDFYRTVSILFILSIVRSFKHLTGDPLEWIGYIPLAIAIGLGFWIPELLKNKFNKVVIKSDENGNPTLKTKIIFEESEMNSDVDDLLDTKIRN